MRNPRNRDELVRRLLRHCFEIFDVVNVIVRALCMHVFIRLIVQD